MKTTIRFAVASAVILATSNSFTPALSAQTNAELDAYWAEVSRTVEEGDFEGYAALYHADAVLVTSTTSFSIGQALEGWKQDFVNAKSGVTKNAVDFRFSERLNDETTAHESGIFRYSSETASGEVTPQYVHFEGLLVKKGRWLMLMERQKAPATVEEWNALAEPT